MLGKLAVAVMMMGAAVSAQFAKLGVSESVGPSLLRVAHGVNNAAGGKGATWKAGLNQYWNGWSATDVKRMLGVRHDDSIVLDVRRASTRAELDALPAELDLRTVGFGDGNNTCIGPVLDQAKCGSCWAFGATEAISDRVCMKSGGIAVALAPLDLTACDQNDGGCEGGDPASAWTYAQGGLATEACIPYLQSNGGPVPTCPPATEPCLDFVDTPACPATCNDGSAIERAHAVGNVYALGSVADMMTELNTNGPIEVAFTVYADFLTYKSGVYQYTTGDALGGHAVKLIGYGTDSTSGLDYWLCQNSWTTTWGDGGYFKIRRGTDECGIEDDAVAGTIVSL